MAKTKWIILLATFIISCTSLALLIVSITTTYWITAEAAYPPNKNNEMNYGLFSGSFVVNVLATPSYGEYGIACDFSDNVCAFSCQSDHAGRMDELHSMMAGSETPICPTRKQRTATSQSSYQKNQTFTISTKADNILPAILDEYMNCGLYSATVSFFVLTIIFALASAIFAIVNVTFNPVEVIFSVFGLYIWNGIAAMVGTFTMLMWGILYGAYLSKNIAVTDTLNNRARYNSNGLASLGFSYWLLIPVIVLHLINIVLVYFRGYLIDKEPPPPTIVVEKNDATILLY